MNVVPIDLLLLLYCNSVRVRIWIIVHYTYTYFNIFFYY